LPVSPEAYVVAEAFRNVYGDEKIDFKNLSRYDLTHFAQTTRSRSKRRPRGQTRLHSRVLRFPCHR
jgi:hypothetical protein